ncbi:MAG: SDR family oxidoreductase [Gemmatimonadota bacterium]|nr:SDR family oxidoreductase [Gemmatimonadota bacterium]
MSELGESPQVALVSGAAGAIGAATVRAFLEEGYAVVGLDRDPAVEDLARERFTGRVVDLRAYGPVTEAIEGERGRGRLLHVVGVAGGALPEEPATQDDPEALSPETFRASIEANLQTQYHLLHAALPWLRESRGEDRSIAFTSSWNALTGCGMPAYSAAKAGLIGMARALAPALGPEGIRVNVVAPGTVRTPRTERIWSRAEGHFERLEAGAALGRLGEPEDVARVFVALATRLTHVTGQVLVVDGGQMVKRLDTGPDPGRSRGGREG